MRLTKKKREVDSLKDFSTVLVEAKPDYENVVGQDDLTRFDKQMKQKKRRPKKKSGNKSGQGQSQQGGETTNKPKIKTTRITGERKGPSAKKKPFKKRRPNNRQ